MLVIDFAGEQQRRRPVCDWCGQLAARFQGVGPLCIHFDPVEDLEVDGDRLLNFGSEQMDQVFCCWECLADWTAEQSGRQPIAPRGSCSYDSQ